MIISKTPFRISFFGGGTDYPAWCAKHAGAVLSTTIDKYCYITIRYLPPFFEHKHRIVYSLIENVKRIDDIKHPAVREILRMFQVKKGVEIHHDGDLPARSGLGSSSSFTVGMLNSLYALHGKMVSKDDLATQAIYVERELLKENVGSQDQVAVACGGLNKIVFHNGHSFKIEPVILSRKRLEQLQGHLMLYFTGVSRIASEIADEQVQNTPKKEKELSQIYSMVDKAVNILTGEKDINHFGDLLDDAWILKKSLSAKISNASIDGLYSIARKNGARGGKILGAGGGGFMLLFVEPKKQPQVRRALKNYLEVKFRFESDGSQIIYYDPWVK